MPGCVAPKGYAQNQVGGDGMLGVGKDVGGQIGDQLGGIKGCAIWQMSDLGMIELGREMLTVDGEHVLSMILVPGSPRFIS